MSSKFVSYLRVSTQKQGRSGLGLEAQRDAVTTHVASANGRLLGEYIEVESGKKSDKERPKLAEALKHAKMTGATLVVAKLDRLSRNVAFLASLMDGGAKFVCADNPHVTKLTVHVLAAVAEQERDAISARTKAALGAAKRRGVKLGARDPGHIAKHAAKGNRASRVALKIQADSFAADVLPIIRDIQAAGTTTLKGIASQLNQRGIQTARNGQWYPGTVRAVMARLMI
ncbi:recombinase family protein [Hyphomicrobium sp. 2TAF46]|uniref:recombinase family protein n=1 Tax=Hyphomicrobium sp. 2TAF46 TaxID=3233019 RepID=UPI003F8F39BA